MADVLLPVFRRRRLQLRVADRRLILMAGDAVAVIAAVLIALGVWSRVADDPFTLDFVFGQVGWFPLLLVLWLALATANDFYDLDVISGKLNSLQRLGAITAQMLGVYLLVFFLSPREALPRLFILYYGVASFILIAAWRLIVPSLVGWASEARRVLIVGADATAIAMIEAIRQQRALIYDVRGVIGQPAEVGRTLVDVPVIGSGSDLINYVHRDRISEIIFTSVPDVSGEIFRSVMQAYESGVVLTPMPLLYEHLSGRVPVAHVHDNWALVLPIEGSSIFDLYAMIKGMMDVALSLIGLLVLAILFVPIAGMIRLTSPGDIFYRQTRVGLNGREFEIIKFRTMIQNAEAQTGAVFSRPGDSRVTRAGRFLRKTRLDELPQVINVLRGDMSLVGPRPERPEHVARLTEKIPFYRTRLVVRPGLTGWAQVRYAYGSDDDDAQIKLEYDLYYIRHRSFWLDLNILIRTAGKVIRMSGV
jgi:exopolysaccharide biosynthesis polyprenyl glycosylphosphotransferase